MSKFFNDYFNIKKMIKEKRDYKHQMARVEAMPEDYKFVFKTHIYIAKKGIMC